MSALLCDNWWVIKIIWRLWIYFCVVRELHNAQRTLQLSKITRSLEDIHVIITIIKQDPSQRCHYVYNILWMILWLIAFCAGRQFCDGMLMELYALWNAVQHKQCKRINVFCWWPWWLTTQHSIHVCTEIQKYDYYITKKKL